MSASNTYIKVKQTYSESELIQGCIKKNVLIQKALFNQYAGKFMSVCYRYANDVMEAEDMVSEGFVRIYNNIHQFKFEGSFEGWMRRIVVNVALKHLQKKKFDLIEIKESHTQIDTLDSEAFTHLGETEILKLIKQLPTGYRTVFNLNVIEGYSHEEIAQMLNIEASTSRSQLVKARKMLQSKIIQLQKIAVDVR